MTSGYEPRWIAVYRKTLEEEYGIILWNIGCDVHPNSSGYAHEAYQERIGKEIELKYETGILDQIAKQSYEQYLESHNISVE